MLECRRVGNIVTDVNTYRDTAMLTCRRVGNIVTYVNNHRDTAMLECRRVGSIVTDVNIYRDTAIRPPCLFCSMFIFRFRLSQQDYLSYGLNSVWTK